MQNYETELDQGHSTSLRSIDIVWKNAVKYVKITYWFDKWYVHPILNEMPFIFKRISFWFSYQNVQQNPC